MASISLSPTFVGGNPISAARLRILRANAQLSTGLEKEFGADGRRDIVKLREGIEARLGSFRELAAAREKCERGREKTVGYRVSNPTPQSIGKTELNP
ncbi:MAG TPA: hypothetical protein VGZ29_00280 [Terriglobia bacterium]|nr:hypothetical protein [Terriglobia bacterium]